MKRTTLFSRLGCLLLAALLLAGLAACAAKPEEKAMPSLPEMMKTITADVTVDTEESVIDSERFSSYFGIDPIDGFEAYASDAMIGSIAHSIALLKLPDGTDAAALAETITNSVDPRKWICVEAEQTVVRQHGQYILVAMGWADEIPGVVEKFDALFA